MKKYIVDLVDLVHLAVDRWTAHKVPRLTAARAYYATFSLAPLALVTIWIAGIIFGDIVAQQHRIQEIGKTFEAAPWYQHRVYFFSLTIGRYAV